MLTEYLTETRKKWDRSNTVGASEIGQCARRTAYLKNNTPTDEGHEEGWGMKERGHWVEAWVVSRLRANGADVHETGDDQVTRSNGFLSATADGWTADISFDVKSFDPRKSQIPEDAHITQVRLGAKLNPATTQALLIYVNASDFQDQREFGPYPELTDEELASLRIRAREIMAKDPEEQIREGYFTNECGRWDCPYRQRCVGEKLEDVNPMPEDVLEELADIQQRYACAKADKEEAEKRCKVEQEAVRQIFQAHKTKGAKGIASISRQTRGSLDTEAMERDGIDLAPYRKEGKPFDVITIRKPKG